MTTSLVDRWHESARSAWPSVDWPRAAFREHVGTETPRFPVDLYLGGAAGYRIDAAWTTIENELAPEAIRILARRPKADFEPEDLWAETRSKLLEENSKPDEQTGEQAGDQQEAPACCKLVRYRGKVALVNYFVTIGSRVAISRARRRREAVGTSDDLGTGPTPGEPTSATAPIDPEAARALETALASAVASLEPEQRALLAMVHRDGMQQQDAGRVLGWSPFKASRQMKRVIEVLRDAAAVASAKVREGSGGAEASQAFAALWERTLQRLQVSPDEASTSSVGNGGTDGPARPTPMTSNAGQA